MLFFECGLDYRDADNPLELPARLTFVERRAFFNVDNLQFIRYYGSKETLNTFGGGGNWNVAKYVRIADEYDIEDAKTYEN